MREVNVTSDIGIIIKGPTSLSKFNEIESRCEYSLDLECNESLGMHIKV